MPGGGGRGQLAMFWRSDSDTTSPGSDRAGEGAAGRRPV